MENLKNLQLRLRRDNEIAKFELKNNDGSFSLLWWFPTIDLKHVGNCDKYGGELQL
jgi:hypothetical protein